MPAVKTRADSIREYLTGGLYDGFKQIDPLLSLGGYRSSIQCGGQSIIINSPIKGVVIEFAADANAAGTGLLSSVDDKTLTWQPLGSVGPGSEVVFDIPQRVMIVEAPTNFEQFLRIRGKTPFSIAESQITLTPQFDNVFGFGDVLDAEATSGGNYYRATIVRNENSRNVTDFTRWIATLGTSQVSNVAQLGPSGSGTIATSGSFSTWPKTGWCRIVDNVGTLREIVYYSQRTTTVLTIPTTGRDRLGTSGNTGQVDDVLYSVPGIAIALDAAGVQPFGNSMELLANQNTAPTGVTWNTAITSVDGLQIGTMVPGQQYGIWIWREIPTGANYSPLHRVVFHNNFVAP